MTQPPTDPHRDETERRVRESLAQQSRQAPEGDMLAERIIHAAGRADAARVRRPIRWGAPLAAAAVLLLLAGVVLAVTQIRFGSSTRAADSAAPTVSRPPSSSPAPTPTPSRTARPTTAAPSSAGKVVQDPTLTGVRITDLTFNSSDSGWALATADCLNGSGGTCTALLHTADGSTWQSRGGFSFNVPGVTGGCATRCVTNIRFADDDTGYAFGPSAFFMTTNGGRSWSQQSGGAIALETFNRNVVRLTSAGSGCPGPCGVQAQTSAIGSTSWTTRSLGLPAKADVTGVSLSRGGSDVYVLATRNPAGGASSATSTLYRSSDNGASWRSSGEPCPQVGGEVDSSTVAAAADGRVSVLCRLRGTSYDHVAVSTDHGATFRAAAGFVPHATVGRLAGDPDVVLLSGGHGLARSVNGGRTWATDRAVTGTVSFVGFESDSVARAVTGGNTIWTTRNGGRSWTPLQFQ